MKHKYLGTNEIISIYRIRKSVHQIIGSHMCCMLSKFFSVEFLNNLGPMAACFLVSVLTKSTKHLSCFITFPKHVRCVIGTKNNSFPNTVERRSADYRPSIWDHKYIQSLRNDYLGETYQRRAEKLKADVKIMIGYEVDHLNQLELIDILQRLGLAYHFEEEISKTLENTYNCSNCNWNGKDLYETALGFRLLRQHGYPVPEDIFKRFLKGNGSFDESIQEDAKGMLSLYEASFCSFDNESIMEEAWIFTSNHLKKVKNTPIAKNVDMELVSHALDMPLHWRMTRLEARWYIDIYETESRMNPVILEFAKLDFNIVQAQHQQELRDISRWWKKLGLGERLSFARDNIVEAYLWAVGITFIPQDGYCRKIITAAAAIITIIDDIYDVYGTLDELVLFTQAVERWDIKSIEELPDYLKISFVALFNTVNEFTYDILKEQNIDVLPHLKKAWLGLLATYLQEAKWYNSGYKPTFEEYMENSWISVAGPLVDVIVYISATKQIKEEVLEYLERGPEIVRFTSMIFRLGDDLATSTDEMKRGDVPKAIQCYMYDTGVSEEVSREHMQELIRQTWKKVNRSRISESPLPKALVEIMLNLTRISHIMYEYGDGTGKQKARMVSSLWAEPIPL